MTQLLEALSARVLTQQGQDHTVLCYCLPDEQGVGEIVLDRLIPPPRRGQVFSVQDEDKGPVDLVVEAVEWTVFLSDAVQLWVSLVPKPARKQRHGTGTSPV